MIEDAGQAPPPGRWRRVAVIASVALAAGLTGAAAWWLLGKHAAPEVSIATPTLLPDTSRLNAEELGWQDTLVEKSGADDAAARLLQGRSGMDGAYALSSFLSGELLSGQLIVNKEGGRRPPLTPATLADGTLASMTARDGAYLYPLELTMLVHAIAVAADVSHDIVLLEPKEPTLADLPQVAVRFTGPEGRLALDPGTGLLRRAEGVRGHGAELLWAAYAQQLGRFVLRTGDQAGARRHLERAAELVPDLWTTRAALAELAIAEGRLDDAQRWSAGLSLDGDHPWAWLVEARVHAAAVADSVTGALDLEARLESIIDAFPYEAALCVQLGDMLAARRRWADAREVYERALDRRPDTPGAHLGLARLYLTADPELARQHLRLELSEHPDAANAYVTLALWYELAGATEEAERALAAGRAVASDLAAFEREVGLMRARSPRPPPPR